MYALTVLITPFTKIVNENVQFKNVLPIYQIYQFINVLMFNPKTAGRSN